MISWSTSVATGYMRVRPPALAAPVGSPMKKIAAFMLGLATLGGIASPPQAYGQPRHGAGGRGYDPSTVETVSGEIVAVERVAPETAEAAACTLR